VANTKINVRTLQTNFTEQKNPEKANSRLVRRRVWSAGSLHPPSALRWAIFIVPRKPQCPDSYRVPDNDRRIAVQAHFSGPQEQRGYIQEHRLQLKFHAEMRIKRHSLHNPNYFMVVFTLEVFLDTP